jgi:hypothetical protein
MKMRCETGTELVTQCSSTHERAQEYSVVVAASVRCAASSADNVPPQTNDGSRAGRITHPAMQPTAITKSMLGVLMARSGLTDSLFHN